MKKDFEGKVALITGSSRGIGLATARELAGRGARIVMNARGAEKLEAAAEELRSEGFEAIAVPADVSDPDACRAMVEKAISEFGRLDILINNAGLSMRSELDKLDPEACRKIVNVNMLGCLFPTMFAIPQLKETQGTIVFISSVAGLIGLPTGSVYCATKMALRGLAESLRCELSPSGVHVGIVYVGFTENDPDKTVEGPQGEKVPHNRPAHMTRKQTAGEIAGLIAKRKKHVVLTPAGKAAYAISRISPEAVGEVIVLSRKYGIAEKLGMR